MWFIGVEVEQETSAPPPKKNPGSAPDKRKQNVSAENISISQGSDRGQHAHNDYMDFSKSTENNSAGFLPCK